MSFAFRRYLSVTITVQVTLKLNRLKPQELLHYLTVSMAQGFRTVLADRCCLKVSYAVVVRWWRELEPCGAGEFGSWSYISLLGSLWASLDLPAWAILSFLKACWSRGSWTTCVGDAGLHCQCSRYKVDVALPF